VRIGLVGPHGPDMSQDNIGECLQRGGHQVCYLGETRPAVRGRVATRLVSLAMTAQPRLERHVHGRLVRAALDRECEAVITTDGTLSPHAVAELRRARIPVALWFQDHVSSMGRQRMLEAPYTALFFKDTVLVQRLRDTLGLPVWYLPQACNPRWHRPLGEPGAQRHIAVVGNTYLSRLGLLRRLHDAGIPLAIHGGPAPRWATPLPPGLSVRRPVFRDDKSRVFRTAAGVLNNLHPAEIHGVNRRLFEATGAGAAVLCERRPALADLYDLDREVIPFTDFQELLDQCTVLLSSPDRTKEIGDAAAKRAHAHHTYEDRMPVILEKLA
jgi:spore maturation protein CgeB